MSTWEQPPRRFTLEYRIEAAHRVIDSNRSVAEVAKELSLVPDTLGRWVKRGEVMSYSSCKNESAWTTMVARKRTYQGGPSHEETGAIHASER
jgi:transposase-like protein